MSSSINTEELVELWVKIKKAEHDFKMAIATASSCLMNNHPAKQDVIGLIQLDAAAILTKTQLTLDPVAAGRTCFKAGMKREECPFAAPFRPHRFQADLEAGPTSVGARWLQGWDEERANTPINL